MGALIRMLFSGLLKRGLPILAGLGIGDLIDKLTAGKGLPSPLPTPPVIFKGEKDRLKKLIITATVAAVVLTLMIYILRKMRIKLPINF